MVILILKALLETLLMVTTSTAIGLLLGIPLAILLYITRPQGLFDSPWIYRVFGSTINAFRSIPYIILIVLLIPITRLLVGSSIGLMASIIPLSFASTLLLARVAEEAFITIPLELIETGQAFGAHIRHIIIKIVLPESLPTLIRSATTVIINLIGFSAMAGAVGGGGLGDLAIRYGYQRYDLTVLAVIVIILIVLVQGVQTYGNWWSQKLHK
ncbi:methionine ABC transporter permease [Candidatus Nucleicultrix amoebiphila]|jgi:D-methionine transport system permease protein|uniref:ABC transmembrane type-1 domain-containing protein n=1 Tax=Candidatus Nucleicultrix amoebiphila FS5 TaxID=1414854 RepID=A0A1W6N442_9PROT|nr:ABC transporter permease subunit [Candidatus Nucleicultrix amoebiphila]ARN84614.1 hypothetical protein GQ61_03995 [Candidatus Nucleicultrix amoebiphila FS5]